MMADETSRLRLAIVGVVVASLFTGLFARLWYLQVISAPDFAVRARANSVRLVTTEAPRGQILDRNGNVLVTNRIANTILLNRGVAGERRAIAVARLAALLHIPVDEIQRRLDDRRNSVFKPIPVAQDVPEGLVVTIREHPSDFPGVDAVQLPVRDYPLGSVAAHVLGYIGEANESELAARKHEGYRLGDRVGKAGVEALFERALRGVPGQQKLEVDSRGHVVRALYDRAPQQGHDVVLGMDLDVQRLAEESLQQGIDAARASFDKQTQKHFLAPGGSVVVLDVNDGSVVALASAPSFRPNDFVNGIRPEVFAALNDPKSAFPLTNRAAQAQYAPGSTFKLVTALASLAHGLITPGSTYDDKGAVQVGNRSFRNALGRSYGRLALPRALTVSSDAFFYALGFRFWRLPPANNEGIQQLARTMGFGAPTGLGLAGERAGRIPDATWKRRAHNARPQLFPDARWFPGDNVNLAVGQGDVLVTPLQLADAYATLANGGRVVTPHLVHDVQLPDGHIVESVAPAPRGQVAIDPSARAAIIEGLRGAVADPRGTAYAAFAGFPLDRVPVAGKTGTAQVRGKQDTSLFAGIVPANQPQYVVVAVVEEAGFGSSVAAPVCRRVMQGLMHLPLTPVSNSGGND